MKARASAVTRRPGRDAPGVFESITVDVEEPLQGEVLVRMAATGLCHSDDHVASGAMPAPSYPIIGGHEGAGVVERVGPHTAGFEVGDHVVFSFLPACGRCRWCATGQQNLCHLGAGAMTGARPGDPTSFRVHLVDGTDVGQMCGLGTFAEYTTVSVNSAVVIDRDLPLDKMCLLGCGVGTGWGAAVHSAEVRPGQTVIIMGIGGVGINAVQGAASAGADNIVAVDPVPFKREKALAFGATHTFASIDEADAFARSRTDGQGADSAIVTIGVTRPEHIGQAFAAVRKAGTVVVTGLGSVRDFGIPVSPLELTLYQKRIQGSLFGQMNPTWDIPHQIQMYRDGTLELDGLVTRTYSLDEVARGYEDMHAGTNIRGVVIFD